MPPVDRRGSPAIEGGLGVGCTRKSFRGQCARGVVQRLAFRGNGAARRPTGTGITGRVLTMDTTPISTASARNGGAVPTGRPVGSLIGIVIIGEIRRHSAFLLYEIVRL